MTSPFSMVRHGAVLSYAAVDHAHAPGPGGTRGGPPHHFVRRPAAPRRVHGEIRRARPSGLGARRDARHRTSGPASSTLRGSMAARASSVYRRRSDHLPAVRPRDDDVLSAARAGAGLPGNHPPWTLGAG